MCTRLLTTLLLLVPCATLAYPILPQTVWHLTKDAEAVVYASVEDVKPIAHHEENWNETVAVLQVEDVWKGEAPKTIEVRFDPDMTCPAPAFFVKGRRVAAFLGKFKDGAWGAVGLSYGTRYPASDVERAELKRAVQHAVALQREGVEATDQRWGLEAYASPSLRWDARYQLQYPLRNVQPKDDVIPPDGVISPALYAELEKRFLARPSYDDEVLQALRLFQKRPSKALDVVFADVIESVLAYEVAPMWTRMALELLGERLAPGVKLDFLETPRANVEEDEASQLRWQDFKKHFKLSPKRRADHPRASK